MAQAGSGTARAGNDVVQHVPVNIRQSHVTAAEAIGELLMIHPGQVQHRRMQVVELTLVFNRAIPVIIRGPIDGAALGSAAAQKE